MSDITDLCHIIHRGIGLNFEDLAEEIISAGFHRDRTVTTAEDLVILQGRARLLSVELHDLIGPVDALLAGTLELFDTADDDVDTVTSPGLEQDPLDFEGGAA